MINIDKGGSRMHPKRYYLMIAMAIFMLLPGLVFAQTYDVILSLDATRAPVPAEGNYGFFATGDFDGWSGWGAELTDADADGIYKDTINVAPGEYRFLFLIEGDFVGWATWAGTQGRPPVGSSCASPHPDDPNDVTYAFTVIDADVVMDPVCWSSCEPCMDEYEVYYAVDLNNETLPDGNNAVFVTGDFDGWSGWGLELHDDDADGIWTGLDTVAAGESRYLYLLEGDYVGWGQWAGWQGRPSVGDDCAVPNPDDVSDVTYGYDARFNNVMQDTVCWNSCVACVPEVAPMVLNGFENAADIGIGPGEFWNMVVESPDLVNNYLNSTLISAEGVPQDGVGAGQFSYSVKHDLGWGGYVNMEHISTDYIDLTPYNYITFYLRNYLASSIDSTMSLRFILMDGSDQTDPAKWSKDSCEYYYAFIEQDFIFDAPDTGWIEIRIPLKESEVTGNANYSEGFSQPNYAGIPGNGMIDFDKITGFAFDFIGYSETNWAEGDLSDGSLWIDNLAAIYSTEIPGCTDPSSLNYDPDATVDDGSCLYPEDVVEVTFKLNMAMETVSPDGVHLAGGGTFGNPGDNPMYDDGTNGDEVAGDLIFTRKWQLLNYQVTDYTFVNGSNTNWSEKENIVGQDCAWGEYSDRHLEVGVNDTTIFTCFGQCSDDGSCSVLDSVLVTFKVNMMDQETDPAGVYMAGGGIGEVGLLMDDSDADDIWELQLKVASGIDFFWKFRNGPGDGNWGGNWEDGDQLGAEGCGANQYNDRMINTDVDLVLDAFCFSSCYPCTPVHDIDVTFTVDMNAEPLFNPSSETPYVFGRFNDWDYINPVALTETAESGIYTTTLTLQSRDTLDYLFGYGSTFEDMTDRTCAIEDPTLGLFIRRLILPIDTTTTLDLKKNVFGTCDRVVAGTSDDLMLPKEFALTAYPNPFNPDVTIQYQIPAHENVKIEVVNMLGQRVKTLVEASHSPGHYSVEWNGRNAYGQPAGTGIYFILVSRASGTSVTKITLLK